MRYLLPYELNNINQDPACVPSFVRKQLGRVCESPEFCEGIVYCLHGAKWYHTYCPYPFPTKEAAMEDLDKHLVARNWKLLTTEQAEKLLPLL